MSAFAVVVTVADVFLITFAEVLPSSLPNDPRGKGITMNGETPYSCLVSEIPIQSKMK